MIKESRLQLLPISLLLFAMVTCIVIVPKKMIGDLVIGLDDTICILLLLPIAWFFFSDSWLLRGYRLSLFCIWLMIIVTGIIFGSLGSLYYLGNFKFPTEMWQYVKRMVLFYFMLQLAWHKKISSKSIYLVFISVLLIAALIGIIQVIPCQLGKTLAAVYARTDGLHTALVWKDFVQSRNYGVAGHSDTWGGFSAFSAALAVAFLAVERRDRADSKFIIKVLICLLCSLSVLNVLFTLSKAAMLNLLAVLTSALVIAAYFHRCNKMFVAKVLGTFGVTAILMGYFLTQKLAFLIFRFMSIGDDAYGRGGRMEQVYKALPLVNDGLSFLFGAGNATQRALAVSWGTEVEPVAIFVSYGLVGLLLRYGLLLGLFIIGFRAMARGSNADRILAIATVSSIVGYSIFSLGCFFFAELYVGLLPWMLYGWVVGSYFRQSRDRELGLDS